MSLQGSLETVSLAEVLTMLASSAKTGELRVVGGPASGRLWFDEGRLVASELRGSRSHADALFELLRLRSGSFVFDSGVAPAEIGVTAEVQPLLDEAQQRLSEWRGIEEVVPSLESRVRLSSDLPAAETMVRADQWHLLVAAAGGCRVQDVLDQLALGEFDGCRGISELVTSGLVEIDRPTIFLPEPSWPEDPVISLTGDPLAGPAQETVDAGMPDGGEAIAFEVGDAPPAPLDPQPEEPVADRPVNRGKLMKFLSSVKS